jgi:bifunctional non-homologous end joining protein LigD
MPVRALTKKRRTLYSLARDEMQNYRWVKPLLVAQINFQEWTPDRHLRHSSFAGLREEKSLAKLFASRPDRRIKSATPL